jgi:malonate transporter and related proteins
MRYDRGVILARDTIFVATVLSVPVILAITWLLAA